MKAKGIFYVSAFVSDLERSKAFYRDTLGWKLGTNEAQVAGFHFGEAYLVLLADERKPDARRYGGGMHVEVMVDDAQAEHARLEKLGVKVSPLKDQFWGERNFSFSDPDGYLWSIGQSTRS
jgi:catechol 2,3-dioxygenase-like lactoylglutathione lyase family enzyme